MLSQLHHPSAGGVAPSAGVTTRNPEAFTSHTSESGRFLVQHDPSYTPHPRPPQVSGPDQVVAPSYTPHPRPPQVSGPDQVVAVLLPVRGCWEAFVSQLGIWKAGAAVVFLDPELPDEVLQSMVLDVQPVAVLTDVQGLGGAAGRFWTSSP